MNEALNVWRAIAEEAECVVERGIKKLVLTEEMCVRLGTAIEAAASAPAVADAAINPEDVGLPPYPKDHVVGPCVCGSWPGGECLKCPVILGSPEVIADAAGAIYQSRLCGAPSWTDVSHDEYAACSAKPQQFETRIVRADIAGAKPVASEIEQFEAWAEGDGLDISSDEDGYISTHTDNAWAAWKALAEKNAALMSGLNESIVGLLSRIEELEAAPSPAIDAAGASKDDVRGKIARALHYPDCWDTAAYPNLDSAILESMSNFICGTCLDSVTKESGK